MKRISTINQVEDAILTVCGKKFGIVEKLEKEIKKKFTSTIGTKRCNDALFETYGEINKNLYPSSKMESAFLLVRESSIGINVYGNKGTNCLVYMSDPEDGVHIECYTLFNSADEGIAMLEAVIKALDYITKMDWEAWLDDLCAN